MGNNKQTRSVQLDGPSALKGLQLSRLSGREQISRPFEYKLFLYGGESGSDGAIDPDKVLGQPVTVTLTTDSGTGTPTGNERYFNGIVTEFAQVGYNSRYHEYYAVLRPALWLLSRRADCRVFQQQATPDIVAAVLKQAGSIDYRTAFSAQYQPWDYRVQYRESDLDFVSRLLEHEGIYYYFEHSNGKHMLVLTDDVAKLTPVTGYETVPFFPKSDTPVFRERDGLSEWSVYRSFQAAAFASVEYNFETPSAGASAASPVPQRKDSSTYEIFDYPAGARLLTTTEVESVAKLRAEQLQAAQSVCRASGDAAGLSAGRPFKLQGHPRSDLNQKYLVVAATLELTSDAALTHGEPPAHSDLQLHVAIEALEADIPYRPERLTARPVIQGAQTAVVCGSSGKEIWTDKYGRVKIQFHWDRAGKSDDSSSCWVRVASSWAGKSWGVHQVPRVGQEVVVSFLEGDPDRPLVIGSVYNAEQMPPYELPTNATRSGVKSSTSADGTTDNFNELRFEDLKGSEEIYLHAEKDMQVVVENNQTISVGATKADKGDRTATIQHDDTLSVGNNLTSTVTNNLSMTVSKDYSVTISGKESRSITGDRTTSAASSDTLNVTTKYELTSGEKITLTCGTAQVEMKDGGAELTLSCGDAQISMKADGTIEISGTTLKLAGTELTLEGTSKATVDAAQTAISGTQLSLSGTNTTVAGSGTLGLSSSGVASLKGSVTQIG